MCPKDNRLVFSEVAHPADSIVKKYRDEIVSIPVRV